jgi:hypothetical protein
MNPGLKDEAVITRCLVTAIILLKGDDEYGANVVW